MVQLSDLIVWIGGVFFVILLLFFILYLRGTRERRSCRMSNVPCLDDPHFLLAISGFSSSIATKGYVTGFWFDVEKIYDVRLEAIRNAKHTIHFETFYMTPGRRADEFAAAVSDRAQAGVEVQLLVDSYGAITLPWKYWKRIKAAGVQVLFYHKFNWREPLTYNIRTHRKLLLIDGEVAYVGGIGVSDYWDGNPKSGDVAPWLEAEIRCKGSIVGILEGIFMQHWINSGGVANLNQELFKPSSLGDSTILVTPTDPPLEISPICTLFQVSILSATERIWIASPYFLPDTASRKALMNAAKKGIDVRILTVGPHNDKKIVYYAVRELYGDLLEAGIKIYEYQPSMMHAKVLLIDERWVSTGSTNFDPRSLFHNAELNLSLADGKLAKCVEEFFECSLPKSKRIRLSEWKKRPLWQRLQAKTALLLRSQL